jgi:hypothetical protein
MKNLLMLGVLGAGAAYLLLSDDEAAPPARTSEWCFIRRDFPNSREVDKVCGFSEHSAQEAGYRALDRHKRKGHTVSIIRRDGREEREL